MATGRRGQERLAHPPESLLGKVSRKRNRCRGVGKIQRVETHARLQAELERYTRCINVVSRKTVARIHWAGVLDASRRGYTGSQSVTLFQRTGIGVGRAGSSRRVQATFRNFIAGIVTNASGGAGIARVTTRAGRAYVFAVAEQAVVAGTKDGRIDAGVHVVTTVFRAHVVIITVRCSPTDATAFRTGIRGGAGVVVVAGCRINCIDTARQGLATVVGTAIIVVAGRRLDA